MPSARHRFALLPTVGAVLALALSTLAAFAIGRGLEGAEARGGAGAGKIGLAGQRALRQKECAVSRRGRHERLARYQRRRARVMRRCQPKRTAQATGAPLYWGASIGEQLTGEQAPWDMNAVSSFESLAGKPLSLIHFFSPFADCSSTCSFYKFPTKVMEGIRQHGAIPFFSWSSQATPSKLAEPDFQLSDVIAGRYDSYIRSFADEAREWDHPFFLRFNWEMNGNWFPWSEGVNGNQPGEYVAAWRHVHDIFSAEGADNVTWTWCPNVDPNGDLQDLAPLYPGDEYVDWTCLDGYNWGTQPGASTTKTSFSKLFGPTYREITGSIAPSKPMVIGEIGASERSGDKAAWIAEMLRALPAEFPQIRALIWFDRYDDGMDWPIETSAAATEAFAGGIQNAAYRGNEYSDLEADPIAPPS